MTRRLVVIELARIEAAHLSGLVGQFSELLSTPPVESAADPAVRRLVPDAYADADDAREFRDVTEAVFSNCKSIRSHRCSGETENTILIF